jgi:hypothetical protein
MIAILSVLIVSSGIVYGWWPQIQEWFQGGEASIPVNSENRGKARHSINYVQSLSGDIIRPMAFKGKVYWSIGGCHALIYS